MDERELRMECIKAVVAMDVTTDWRVVIAIADGLFDYVKTGNKPADVETGK